MKFRLIPVLVVCVLAGCSKVHDTRTFALELGDVKTVSISAPVSEQKLNIVLTSDQPVSVWVLLEKDVPAGKESDPGSIKNALATKTDTKEASFDVTIPAKEAFRVMVTGGNQKANVTVKIDSK